MMKKLFNIAWYNFKTKGTWLEKVLKIKFTKKNVIYRDVLVNI